MMKLETALKKKFGDQVTKQVSSVDPTIAREMVKKAAIAVAIAAHSHWRFIRTGTSTPNAHGSHP